MKISTICYLEDNHRTLMLYRNKKANDMHEGKWVGIGGKFEWGETPEECVAREFLEETGLCIKNPQLRGVIVFPGFYKDEDWMMFVFTCNEYTGDLLESNEGTLKWVDTGKVHELKMWEGDRLFLEWMNEDRFFSAKVVYQNGALENYTVCYYQ